MEKKLNPLQMVVREMTEHSDMDAEKIETALMGLLEHLNHRAVAEIDKDPHSQESQQSAVQYRVVCELIAMFGTQLIAFEDIEAEMMGPEPN